MGLRGQHGPKRLSPQLYQGNIHIERTSDAFKQVSETFDRLLMNDAGDKISDGTLSDTMDHYRYACPPHVQFAEHRQRRRGVEVHSRYFPLSLVRLVTD